MGEFPSKTHSLIYFVDKLELDMTELDYQFVFMLNKISVPTRYPDNLRNLFKAYSNERTADILKQTKKIQSWIKQQ